ncbi:hypothetical protein BU16DRAFT_525388 [Lophium mytilinum]|uniref:Uncharacterized protein n=1 Tax=Lophium mytilinum TaxID=390894 RepID=A0A6A6QZV6_9PEZI|nr:hypothetical protein BU16DRAFT_525388 [Lophium mytilinum]
MKCVAPFLTIQDRSTSGLTRKWYDLAQKHYGQKPKDLTWEAVQLLGFAEDSSLPQSLACQVSHNIRKFEAKLDIESLRRTKPSSRLNTIRNTKLQKRKSCTAEARRHSSKRVNASGKSLVQVEQMSHTSSLTSEHEPVPHDISIDQADIHQTLRRPSVSTISPPESPQHTSRPTLLDVEHHPIQTLVEQAPPDISDEDECAEEFRLALKAILSKIADTLKGLVLDKELDERVICAVADALESQRKICQTYNSTDFTSASIFPKVFKFQDRIALLRHQYNLNSPRQRLPLSDFRSFVELLRRQQEELTLAYSFQHEDARLRALKERPGPVRIDIQQERTTLKTVCDHIEEFAQTYTYQLTVNLPTLDELELEPSSGMATLILRILGVQSQLTAISRRRMSTFSQSKTLAIMSALIVSALCNWVYESAFPSGPEDNSLRYQLMRNLMGTLEKRTTLDEVDWLLQEDYLKHEVFLEQILRPRATLLARRLSKTLAPCITYSPGASLLPSIASQPGTDIQSDPFHTWGQPTEEWETRERLFTSIFEEALKQKARMLPGDEEYEMMLPLPGAPWDEAIMEAHEQNHSPDYSPTKVSACLSPALFVYAPLDNGDSEPRFGQPRQSLNYMRFRTFDDAERARRKGKCIIKAQVVLWDIVGELRAPSLSPSHTRSLHIDPLPHSSVKRDRGATMTTVSVISNLPNWSGDSSDSHQRTKRRLSGDDRESTLEF